MRGDSIKKIVIILLCVLLISTFLTSCSKKLKTKEVIIGEWKVADLDIFKNTKNVETLKITKDSKIQFLSYNVLIDDKKYNYDFIEENKIKIYKDDFNIIFDVLVKNKNSIVFLNKLLKLNLDRLSIETINIEYDN